MNSMDMSQSKLQEIVKDREAWRAVVHGVERYLVTEQQWNINKPMKLELTSKFKCHNRCILNRLKNSDH